MATSAFKSATRRGSSESKSSHPTNLRRSHSVNAVSRKIYLPFDDNSSISAEFSVRRENPLFWTSSSSSSKEEITRRKDEIKQSLYPSKPLIDKSSSSSVGELRGRSVTRSGSVRKGIGRSLSRVRGLSVSGPQDESISESGNEMDAASSTNTLTRGRIKKEYMVNEMSRTNSVKNRVDRWSVKNSGLTTVQNRDKEWSEDDSVSSRMANLEDGFSTGSLSEAEEKTIKAVCEGSNAVESRAFQRKDIIGIVTTIDLPDMPSDFVNLAAIKLVPHIRQDCSIKLQESRERARKLREDLAVEELREKELGKIFFEIMSDSNSSQTHRSRFERKTSYERKRISKCLNEEALAYFDECVSLSTFDSSDFSASEDPSNSLVANSIAVDPFSPMKGSSSELFCKEHVGEPRQKQVQPLHSCNDSWMTMNRNSSSMPGINHQPNSFSFSDKESNTNGIRRYIKDFERGKNGLGLADAGSYHEADECSIHDRFENVFVDRVLYSSRIESGGLHLCSGGFL